jgi:hypothetical protein
MTFDRNTVVCFSGHRYYAATPEDEARLFAAVDEARADGWRVFISGMAPGFDLAAAETVVRLRKSSDIKLIAAVPFPGQPRDYSSADLARYEGLLAAADEVCVLSERYSRGCYYRRDEWMVDRSGRIICWYNPSGRARASDESGASDTPKVPGRAVRIGNGTRYTVRHAVKSGLEVVNLFHNPNGVLF